MVSDSRNVSGGMSSEECDELTLKAEELLERGEPPIEVVQFMLQWIPDSEHGLNGFNRELIQSVKGGDDE